jgi:hypothetical protein
VFFTGIEQALLLGLLDKPVSTVEYPAAIPTNKN